MFNNCYKLFLLPIAFAVCALLAAGAVRADTADGIPAVGATLQQALKDLSAGQADVAGKFSTATNSVSSTHADQARLERGIAVVEELWGKRFEETASYTAALNQYQQALAQAARTGDASIQEEDLGEIGIAYTGLGQYDKALDYDQQALSKANKAGDAKAQDKILGNIGIIHDDLGQYDKALDYDQQALSIAAKIGDTHIQEDALGNIGIVYRDLGQYDKALDYDQQALALDRKIGDVHGEEEDLGNIGIVCDDLGQYDKALDYDQQSLALATILGDTSGQDEALGNIGSLYDALGMYDKALDNDRQALALDQTADDARGEEVNLCNIGGVYADLGQYDKALDQYRQALILQRQIGDTPTQGLTLNNLMIAEQQLKEPDLAIYYGKQSVDTYQTIRARVARLDAATQKAYLATVESTYRRLADLLIDQGRLPEAEQVLAMLKDQEATDFVQRDAALAPPSLAVSFDPSEQAADSQGQKFADPIVSIGRQLYDLKALKQRTPDQAARIVALSGQLDAAKAAYDRYAATDLPRELAAAPDANRPAPADVSPIQQQLRTMGPGTVAVITLVEPDYLRLIVVTSQTQKAETSPISAADLRRLVGQWRIALENSDMDPRPLGKQLAAAIIGPIQADLNGAGALTILFSLDDVLRYVPMAALYDGGHYLVEKYRVAVFTGATLTAPAGQPADWSASPQALLALGVTQAHELPDLDTGQELRFPALPGVAREIDEIARTKTSPDGILPGEALEDGQFTAQNLQLGLATGYPVVHVASHFELGAKDTTSFLLLGDGTALTLDKLFHKGGQVFQGVDLLTLSACQTGEDVASSDGHQFESLGMVAEAQGAQSILASLWPVSDASTPLLMRAFYDKRANVPGMTKAEALRQAQIEMLRGQGAQSISTPVLGRDATALPTESSANPPAYTSDPKAPYAHPYFWAPFVLIGDWK